MRLQKLLRYFLPQVNRKYSTKSEPVKTQTGQQTFYASFFFFFINDQKPGNNNQRSTVIKHKAARLFQQQ